MSNLLGVRIWMRVIQGTALGSVVAVLAVTIATGHADLFTLFPLFSALALALSIGYSLGVSHVLRGLQRDYEASFVECLGGPMDGSKVPKPPGWERPDVERFTMGVEGHDGLYVREQGRLVWEED